MSRAAVVRTYLEAMAAGNLEVVTACFAPGGLVTSPVYGGVPVGDFYRRLFVDTRAASVELNRIYTSDDGRHIAAHFGYRWERTDGRQINCDLVDLFDFAPGTELIEHLTIIFDTAPLAKPA